VSSINKRDDIMNANRNSIDTIILSVFKIELQNIEALNRGCHSAVIEYLTQRIAEIEDHPPKADK
jgi:hypothetical protein